MPPHTSNKLLDQLPPEYLATLLPRMRSVELPVSARVYVAGEAPHYAHFMTSGVMSIVTFLEDGRGVEVGLVGSEGLVEAFHLLGTVRGPTDGFMQIKGSALRLPFSELRHEFQTCEPFRNILNTFMQAQHYILNQLSACNRLHEVDNRLARWLLMVKDRIGTNNFYLTQEFLAEMIGTRRTTVTFAAQSLQRLNLIHYTRGHIRILDVAGLEAAACECYAIVRDLNLAVVPVSTLKAIA